MSTTPNYFTFDIKRMGEALVDLQRWLECRICLDLMKTPMRTRCGHSFCQTCIVRHLHQKNFCPLCRETLNKRSISKDDFLESCLYYIKNLIIVTESDSHIDILSYLKQPRDTRECYSNSSSSQSSVTHKTKQMRKRSICSNRSTPKTDRPSTSRRTEIDCDNLQYDANLLTEPGCDQTSSTLTDVRPLPTDGNDNMLYDTDVKVRTWIHSLIESEPETTVPPIIKIEDEIRSSEDMFQADKDTKTKRPSDVKNTDSDSRKLKHNAKVRTKDGKKSADAGKSDTEERACSSRDGTLSTHQFDTPDCSTSYATNISTVSDKPFFADTTWSRVKEFGKEMRDRKKKVKKLSVSTEKSSGKSSIEKCNESTKKNNEQRNEKHTEKASNMSKSAPRIIEDIILPREKYEFLDRSATNNNMNNKEEANVFNRSWKSDSWRQDAINRELDLSDAEIKTKASANQSTTCKRKELFANDKDKDSDSSMLEANSQLEISSMTLPESEKMHIKKLNSCQMNEIIGFKEDSRELVDDVNIRKGHLVKKKKEEQEEDAGIMMTQFDSSSSCRQRLIVLTPEKLNESVDKSRTSCDNDSWTSTTKLANPMTCLSIESRTPRVNNNAEGVTTSEEESHLRSQTPSRSRLSLKRSSNVFESPTFSQVPLMERMLIEGFYSKNRKNVHTSVSNNGPFFDRLAAVKCDLSSQINSENCSSTDQATTSAGVSLKNTVVVKDNNKKVINETVRIDKKLSVERTGSNKSRHVDNRSREKGCGFFVKFMQLGTLIRRREVKYYYRGATKREQHLPARIQMILGYNMQQSDSKSEIHCVGNKLQNFESSLMLLNDSQDSSQTDVTVLENLYYVQKSAASLDNIVLDNTTRLTHGIPTSSTTKANVHRHLDRAETTARGSSSTSVVNKPSIAERALCTSPHTSCEDQNATQQRTLRAHLHTTNSIKLLSPDKDSQLKFLTIDSPMSQHGQSRLASPTRPIQSDELERASTSEEDNLAEVRDSQRTAKTFESSSNSSKLKSVKKRKKDNDDDNDDSSSSAISVSSQCTVKLKSNRNEHESEDKTSAHSSSVGKKRRLSSSCDRDDDVICFDSDDQRRKMHKKKLRKKIVSISDSDTELEQPTRVAKPNRNESDNRCDQGNASITRTPKKRKSAKRASDEDLRIRNIVDKWSNEYSAAQTRPTERTKSNAQDTVRPVRLIFEKKMTTYRRSSFSTNSTGDKCGSVKLSGKNTESNLFFESNSMFNSEGLEQLATCQLDDKSSKVRKESSNSMDPLADDIINKVLQINRSQQSNPSAYRSTDVTSRTNDEAANQRNKSEYNLLQDNFDEIIANVELPQSEDVIACSELPARRNPDRDRNLNRTLTEQNMSSCPAMTNELRDVARHGQMKLASSTADIFEHCDYSGKTAKKAYPIPNISGNSDKENTVSHGQRKHDHAEEDRRDKKNVTARSPEAVDKAGREKIVSKNNVSQGKRECFERVEVTERTPRMEKEINVPVGSTSRANDNNDRVQGKASDNNESSVKDLSFDSLMNITLDQARLKMIEEDLFGVAPTRIGTIATKTSLDGSFRDSFQEEQRTPKKRKRGAHEKKALSQEYSADEDDIVENTPETKMRNSDSSGKTIGSSARRDITTLNLSPIPNFSEQSDSTTCPHKKATPKSNSASTSLRRPNLMYPLYQSTPKVASNSMTTGRHDDVSTMGSKGQLDKQRATTSGAVPLPMKWIADGDNTSRNVCQQFDRRKRRFVCTGLSTTQIANVQKFACLHDVDYVKQFDPSVTHVIVNTVGAENAAKSTLKYLQGIAHCKWVVSYKWIEDCINQGRLLPEPLYEATTQSDINLGPGPRNSRLSQRGLFENFTFFCIGPYDNVSLSQYQDLLRATGAIVVDSLEALIAEKKGLKGVVIQGDTHENSIIESWYRDVQAVPILIDWIVECIGHYKLFQLMPYIQTLSPQDYYAIGYPREIIGEEEYSDVSSH